MSNNPAYGSDPRRKTHFLVLYVLDGVEHAAWYESLADARRAVADARFARIAAWIESRPC